MSSAAENAKRAGNLEVLRILSVSASTIDREWSSRVGVGKRGDALERQLARHGCLETVKRCWKNENFVKPGFSRWVN